MTIRPKNILLLFKLFCTGTSRKSFVSNTCFFMKLLTFFCEKNILRFLEIRSTGKSFSEALILATPSRTPRISGLKSQILKPTFLS